MPISSLAKGSYLTDKCDNRPDANGIYRITPHQMVAHWTGEFAAKWFQNNGMENSVNYCIGYDGDIWCNVDEKYRAWTSGSWANDSIAITVELANTTDRTSGAMTDATIEAFIQLCVDLIKRYPTLGGKFNYTGYTNGNISLHRWFQNTNCPAAWFEAKIPYIQSEVNKRLGASSKTVTPNVDRDTTKDQVLVNVSDLNVRTSASLNGTIIGCASKGYYNVYESKTADGYAWNRIADNQWIAFSSEWETFYEKQESYEKLSRKGFCEQAIKVINGDYGNGQTRVNKLTEKFGADQAAKIQKVVDATK